VFNIVDDGEPGLPRNLYCADSRTTCGIGVNTPLFTGINIAYASITAQSCPRSTMWTTTTVS
jgi:hypothetical protein